MGFQRRASVMRSALEAHFTAAQNAAVVRGAQAPLKALETCLNNAVATINVSPQILAIMVLNQPYLSYHRALDRQLRQKAEDEYHAHRTSVDATIHPGYEKEIIYAALNPNGAGLTTYGSVTIQLKQSVLDRRASLLRENAFFFFERYRLGEHDRKEEQGWRAEWADRAKLGVAHLAESLTEATTASDLAKLVLTVGETRADDRLIEVHIHGQINIRNVDCVSLDQVLDDDHSKLEWTFAREKLRSTRVSVTERVTA
jgi:hypothetical protein